MKNNINTHRKPIKIADLDKFEVFVFAPVYKEFDLELPNYFIDDNTGENIGQHLELLILPGGTFEEAHHSMYVSEQNQIIKFVTSDLPNTKAYRNWLKISESGDA